MTDLECPIVLADRLVNEHAVDGWMGGNIHQVVIAADKFQKSHGIDGDIIEIGIHHGRLFFVLAAAAREHEACIAVDIFDNQALNVDHSGSGSKKIFLEHLDSVFPHLKGKVRIVEGDSMGLTTPTIREKLGTAKVRLFSIDGGHTRLHAINDLVLAQELVVGGGLVLLDDFFGPHWPEVTEGFFEFMARYNRRLAPVMFFENKLFLTTFSEHQMMLDMFAEHMQALFGDAFHVLWKFTDITGFKILSWSKP